MTINLNLHTSTVDVKDASQPALPPKVTPPEIAGPLIRAYENHCLPFPANQPTKMTFHTQTLNVLCIYYIYQPKLPKC